MPNRLINKLERFCPLSDDDRQWLIGRMSPIQTVEADQDLIAEGQHLDRMIVILDGLACRYRILDDGSRQIITLLLPGDISDTHDFLMETVDHSISTLSRTRLVTIEMNDILEIIYHRPRLFAALAWTLLVEKSILRERIISLGRRDAAERVAYMLCELHWRYDLVGLGHEQFTVTQDEIADALGLTPAWVNRVLNRLRQLDLIEKKRGSLKITNDKAMCQLAGFDPRRFNSRQPADIEAILAIIEQARND